MKERRRSWLLVRPTLNRVRCGLRVGAGTVEHLSPSDAVIDFNPCTLAWG